MITYEFKCIDCNNEFEEQISLSDYNGVSNCPKCNHISTRHYITPPSIDTYFPGSFKDQNPVHGI